MYLQDSKKKKKKFCFCNRFLNLKWSSPASRRLSGNNSQSVSAPFVSFLRFSFLCPPLILNLLFYFICFWTFSVSPFFLTLRPLLLLLQPFLLHPSVLRSLTQLSHSWSIPAGLAFSILRLCRGQHPPLPPPPTVTVAGMNRRQIKGVCVCERLLSSHFLSSPSSSPAAPLPLWSASITFNRLHVQKPNWHKWKSTGLIVTFSCKLLLWTKN